MRNARLAALFLSSVGVDPMCFHRLVFRVWGCIIDKSGIRDSHISSFSTLLTGADDPGWQRAGVVASETYTASVCVFGAGRPRPLLPCLSTPNDLPLKLFFFPSRVRLIWLRSSSCIFLACGNSASVLPVPCNLFFISAFFRI